MKTSSLKHRVARWAAAALVVPAFVVVAEATPAAAAACTQGTGVTVVVGTQVDCVPGSGGNARAKVSAAGHSQVDVPRQPGAVCRIDGFPAAGQPCFETDAYWALYWSDGTSGSWVYSELGVNSLSIPTGGWVAWIWPVERSSSIRRRLSKRSSSTPPGRFRSRTENPPSAGSEPRLKPAYDELR